MICTILYSNIATYREQLGWRRGQLNTGATSKNRSAWDRWLSQHFARAATHWQPYRCLSRHRLRGLTRDSQRYY